MEEIFSINAKDSIGYAIGRAFPKHMKGLRVGEERAALFFK